MYYPSYEDYMRNVFGYNMPTYNEEYYSPMPLMSRQETPMSIQNEKPELYPEIYRIVYPMVRKVCEENPERNITKELVEKMTNVVYTNIETEQNRETNINVTVGQRNGDVVNPRVKSQVNETRNRPNNGLRDLITILILRELFARPQVGMPPHHNRTKTAYATTTSPCRSKTTNAKRL